jgi:hypothetical protein
VLVDHCGGGVDVARGHGVADGAVLGVGDLVEVAAGAVAVVQEHRDLPADLQPGALEAGVPRGPDEDVVEGEVEFDGLRGGVAGVELPHPVEDGVEFREVGRGETAAGALDGEALQRPPQRVDLLGVLGGEGDHLGAPVAAQHHQAFAGELDERLAHRPAAHAERGGELGLPQVRALGEQPGGDHLADRGHHGGRQRGAGLGRDGELVERPGHGASLATDGRLSTIDFQQLRSKATGGSQPPDDGGTPCQSRSSPRVCGVSSPRR